MIGKTLSHYRIIKELGRGGMGEVYLAEDSKLERKVALKFLPAHYTADPQVNARFQREAKAAAALNHPNIITVYEIGEHEGRAYIAMEYVDGQSLREIVETHDHTSLRMNRILDILSQVCEGLAKAHAAGIVHRDLKPENIMLDADGKPKILDFGLAQMQGKSKLTSERSTMGTLFYMSPEQLEGANVDHRADIWAAGVMLYEMVAGRLPFEGEYEQSVIYSISHEEPEPLARYKTGVSPDLQHIVDKALDKDRDTRYQGIAELLADLKRERKSSAISKKAISSARSRKMKRAVLRFAALAAVVVLAVVAGMFVFKPQPAPKIPATHTQVTFVGDASNPAISPDGQFVAYARGKTDKKKLIVEDLANNQALQISTDVEFMGTADEFSFLEWTPNGSALSFSGFSESSSFGTYTVARLGGNIRRTRIAAYESWSPDGAYVANANQNWQGINITNTTTERYAGLISISSKEPYRWLHGIEWSPLSGRLLFLRSADDKWAIWTIKIDGSEMQKVVENNDMLYSPQWASNGTAIYYFQATGRMKQLMKIKISTKTGEAESEPEILQSSMEAGGAFSISRDNKRLFYTRELRYSNLWHVDLGSANTAQSNPPKPLTTGTLAHFAPSFSPDGKKIVFSITKDAHANLFVMPIASGQMQQLTFMDAFNTSPVWSPNGQEIAFASKQDEKSIVMKLKATGGQPQPFQNSKISSNLALTWSPGQNILYLKPGNRNYQKLDPRTQKETPLVDNESVGWIFSPSYSPDGKSVALWRNDQWESFQTGLWIISLQDSSQKLLKHSFSLYPITWSEESQWIYALDAQKSPYEISKISAISGEAETVFTLPLDEVDGLTITPDGKQLVYAAVEKKSDLWYMEHFDPENELEKPFEAPDSPDLELLAYWEKANNLRREKKYAEAEKVYREGLEIDSAHRGLLHDLGWCLNNDKKYVEAEEVFRDGMARYPEDSGFYNGLGWSLNWQRKYADAEEIFQKGLELNPKSGGILNGIRWAALENKNYEMAKRYNEEYLARGASPTSRRSIHSSLGAIGILLKDYDYAEKHFRQAFTIDTTHSQALRGMGYLLALQNRYAEAEKYAWQALGLDSSFANYNLTAWILVSSEIDFDRGIAFAEKALASKPENWQQTVETYPYLALPEHTLGLAYLKIGEFENAKQYLEQAAAFVPQRQAIQEDLQRARDKLTEK